MAKNKNALPTHWVIDMGGGEIEPTDDPGQKRILKMLAEKSVAEIVGMQPKQNPTTKEVTLE